AYPGGQLGENARDFVLLLTGRLDEVVVGVDDVLGLDEERLAALGAVVDDAAHAAARLGPYGHDVPAVPERDVPVGEKPVGVAPLEGALELGGELAAALANLTAQTLESRARVIGHAPGLVEGLPETVDELGEAGQGVGDGGHVRTGLARGPAVGAEFRARIEHGNDLHEFEAVENAAVGMTS